MRPLNADNLESSICKRILIFPGQPHVTLLMSVGGCCSPKVSVSWSRFPQHETLWSNTRREPLYSAKYGTKRWSVNSVFPIHRTSGGENVKMVGSLYGAQFLLLLKHVKL